MNALTSPRAMIGGSGDIPFVINAQTGQIEVNSMRPFFGEDNAPLIVVNAAGDTSPVTNALLRYQEWLDIDREVIQSVTSRLVGIEDLRSRSLVHNLGSIGQTISMWQSVSEMTEANVSMDGVTAGEEDTIQFGTQQVPVPIIHKDWRLNMRRLQASRMFGESLDTTAAAVAGVMVAEASERMLFSGAPIRVDGSTIYGYRNFPSRGTVDLAESWLTASPAAIKADVQAMIAQMRARKYFGGFVLYIPAAWEGVLDEFFVLGDDTAGLAIPGKTIRETLLALSGLEDIKVADLLGDDEEAVLVSMDKRTVDIAIAQEPTTISWQALGGMQERFKTFAAWVPRLKVDFAGNTGVVHLRAA